MGCSTCRQRTVQSTYQGVLPQPIIDTNCSKTLEELTVLQEKVQCLINKELFVNITQFELVSFLGLIQTMINLGQYCKYELSNLTQRIENVEC